MGSLRPHLPHNCISFTVEWLKGKVQVYLNPHPDSVSLAYIYHIGEFWEVIFFEIPSNSFWAQCKLFSNWVSCQASLFIQLCRIYQPIVWNWILFGRLRQRDAQIDVIVIISVKYCFYLLLSLNMHPWHISSTVLSFTPSSNSHFFKLPFEPWNDAAAISLLADDDIFNHLYDNSQKNDLFPHFPCHVKYKDR